MEIVFGIVRVQESGQDYLKVTAVEQVTQVTARIDVQFSEVDTLNQLQLATFFKNLKVALSDKVAEAQAVQKEQSRNSLLTTITTNLNTNLPGSVDQTTVDDFKTRVY